ncbi:Flavin reductase like domain-containing protein [Ruminococcaceae bacterium FB2012]|nr:Flavin reductase like domain-containing protein [Ruminococcaceae bacterium FB2012]
MKNISELTGFRKLDIAEAGKDFDVFTKIGAEWMLVTAGTEKGFNTMTASWGFAGIMWNKPCVIAAIRPQRYTKRFIDSNELFTLSFYPADFRKELAFCGSNSGRDVDKCEKTGLVPVAVDGSVAFEQAQRILVCRKLYAQQMTESSFIDRTIIDSQYRTGDYHTAYYGEIIAVYEK